MTLAELMIHVSALGELCNAKKIRADQVEIYFVDNVLFDTPSGTLLKSKRPISSLEFNGNDKQLMLFEPTSWEQNRIASKNKPK